MSSASVSPGDGSMHDLCEVVASGMDSTSDPKLVAFPTHCSVCGRKLEWDHEFEQVNCPDRCTIPADPVLREALMREMKKWRDWPPKAE